MKEVIFKTCILLTKIAVKTLLGKMKKYHSTIPHKLLPGFQTFIFCSYIGLFSIKLPYENPEEIFRPQTQLCQMAIQVLNIFFPLGCTFPDAIR